MSTEQYALARKVGLRIAHACRSRGEEPTLPVLSERVPNLNRLSQVSLGLTQIAMGQIEGTVTRGRTAAFSRGFFPLLEAGSEFANKWSNLYGAIEADGQLQPVVALEYYNRYYIVEGNKRISVLKRLDAPLVEANVTRVLPEAEDTERYRAYQEFLRFYADTKIAHLVFEREGDYPRLYALMGKTPGEAWTAEERFDFQSFYDRFLLAYAQQASLPMSAASALLTYLDVFGFEQSVSKTPAEFSADIARIRSEFAVAAAKKPAALLGQPAEKPATLVSSVKSALRIAPKPLRCAFVYNSSPDVSGWTYWHELGRKALEEAFGSRVETVRCDNVLAEDAHGALQGLIDDGFDVIFACSPVFLDACIRQSVANPRTKILNCSLLAIYHNVRSYYLRIYEAKFILGAIAGALAEDGRIGYIADYPIYGTPASINAFAIGAQMTNPRARILLDWTCLPDHDPEKALRAQGVCVLSSRDIKAPHMDTKTFGLYRVEDGEPVSLAMPVWNWSRLYEGIVRSIASDAYAEEGAHNADRAMNYYMGMSSGAIDIVCSKRVPDSLQRLCELLRDRVRDGAFAPFIGPLRDQAGNVRIEEGEALSPQQIIDMDYLAENVDGRLPRFDELSDVAKNLAALQGVSVSAAPTGRRDPGKGGDAP